MSRGKGQQTGRCANEPLPGLTVPTGLTDQQLGRLRTLVHAGQRPRVRLLDCAGQVAGQRGTVVAVGQPATEGAEFIAVRMDHDGDVLPFAPHELHLLTGPDVGSVVGPHRPGHLTAQG